MKHNRGSLREIYRMNSSIVDKNGMPAFKVLVVEQLSGYTVSSYGYYYKDKQSNEAETLCQ